jgi:uncharacterized protein YjbK
MTEIEWKLGLSRRDYARLLRALGPGAPVRRSHNRYWDTADRWLRRSGCGLRLRSVPGAPAILTFKYPAPDHASSSVAGTHRRGESECRVSPEDALALRRGRRSPLDLTNEVARRARAILEGRSLVVLGDVVLYRYRRCWNGLVLELDRFTIGRVSRYEVEIEHPDPEAVRKRLRPYFRKLRIPWRPRLRTKVSYLYQADGAGTHRRRHASRKPASSPRRNPFPALRRRDTPNRRK